MEARFPMLKLQTLGSLSLQDGEGNEVSSVLSQPKRLALFIYLALARPRGTHRRDHLLTLFWPERRDSQARNSLSQSLSFLRQQLPEPVIPSGGGEAVGLEAESVDADVDSFEAAIEAGRWVDALDLYRGDFLRGFHIGDAWGFEDWVETERERLREMAAGAAWSLAHEQVSRGALVEGERTAQKALGLVWSDETPLRKFIEALAREGDRSAALKLYEKFCCRLRDELDLEPSAQTEATADAIRNGSAGEAASAGPPPEEGGPPSTRALETVGKRSSLLPWVAAAAVALVVWGYSAWKRGAAPELDSHLVVVAPFENRTGEPELEEWAVVSAEWVAEAVQQVEGVDLLPLGDTRQIVAALDEEGSVGHLRGLAERTGAGWVVSGILVDPGDSLEFRVEIIDAARWARNQAVNFAGPKEDPREAIRELARRVSGALAYQFDPTMEDIERGGQVLPMPPTIEAFREHRLGYEAFDREDWEASHRHHLAAYDLDTMLVRAVVAAAYVTPDHGVKDSLATFANQRRHMLSLRGLHDLDILLALVKHDLQGVLRVMRQNAGMNRTGYSAVTHAWAALAVNLPGEAVEALSHYDPYPEWRQVGSHPYWDYLTQAFHMLEDYDAELEAARAGRGMYPMRPDLMAAEVRSLVALGRVEEVLELVHGASALPQSPPLVMQTAGEELRAHGFRQASIEVFEVAVEVLVGQVGGEANLRSYSPGDKVPPLSHRLDLAKALYGAERFDEAQGVALPLVGESTEGLFALGLVGAAAARLGDRELANETDGRLAAISRPGRPWESLYLRARIAAVLGEPEEAMRHLREAVASGLRHGDSIHREMDFESLRDRMDYQALVRPKG